MRACMHRGKEGLGRGRTKKEKNKMAIFSFLSFLNPSPSGAQYLLPEQANVLLAVLLLGKVEAWWFHLPSPFASTTRGQRRRGRSCRSRHSTCGGGTEGPLLLLSRAPALLLHHARQRLLQTRAVDASAAVFPLCQNLDGRPLRARERVV